MNNSLNVRRFILLFLAGFGLLWLPLSATAQIDHEKYDRVKDTIISRFNRYDFDGIYTLFDTAFRAKVSKAALVKFLKGNQNSGKITGSKFREEKGLMATYLLSFELRDMLMDLELDNRGQISSLGLKNSPPVLLGSPADVKTNNPKLSPLDLAIDSAVQAYFRNPATSTLTIVLVRNDIPYVYIYGATNEQEIYEIGSITKTFTATLLAQAVLEGRVKLSDDIRNYLAGNYPNLQFRGVGIKLQDLANHTSRLPSMPPDIGDQAAYDPVYPEAHYDAAAFYAALHRVVLDTLPGYKFQYSNWGISLLGHILERVYRKPETALLKTRVTGPLEMQYTAYANEIKGTEIAAPHAENGKTLKLSDQGYFYPAGGLCSTAADMLRYLRAQIAETMPAIKLTHQPTVNNTGLGWGVRRLTNTRDLQHNGSEQGSNANITVYPELHSGCVVMANSKASIAPLVVRIQQLLKQPGAN